MDVRSKEVDVHSNSIHLTRHFIRFQFITMPQKKKAIKAKGTKNTPTPKKTPKVAQDRAIRCTERANRYTTRAAARENAASVVPLTPSISELQRQMERQIEELRRQMESQMEEIDDTVHRLVDQQPSTSPNVRQGIDP